MISWAEVRTRRLARSSLLERGGSALDVARAACAVQAQLQVSAEIQLAVRSASTARDVRSALWEAQTLVKAWTLRGTLHVHAADDFPLWFAATRGERRDGLEEWRDPNGVLHPALSAKQVVAAHDAIDRALGNEAMTREELAAVVPKAVRTRVLSGFAFFTGDLVQGPPRGNKVTLARAPTHRTVSRDQAIAEACRRFLWTYGPARPAEMREWLGVDAPEPDLEEIDVEGRRTYVLAGDTEFPEPVPSVRLLPEYDAYVMASREREQLVPERVRAQVAAHARGRYEGPAGVRFLMVDGVAAGLWERKKSAKRIEISVAPAVRLTKAQRAELDAEAERIARFFDLELDLEVGV